MLIAFPLRVSDLKVHSVQDDRLFYSFYKFGGSLGTSFAIDTGRHDASSIAGTLTAGEESADGDVLQCLAVADDAHRGRGAGLHAYHRGLVGEESARGASEVLEPFL